MTLEQLARSLTEAQRGLLDDLCGCPGLFAGQYVFDGAGIEHLPRELWKMSYQGAAGVMGLGKATPTETGLALRQWLIEQDDPADPASEPRSSQRAGRAQEGRSRRSEQARN